MYYTVWLLALVGVGSLICMGVMKMPHTKRTTVAKCVEGRDLDVYVVKLVTTHKDTKSTRYCYQVEEEPLTLEMDFEDGMVYL